MQTRIDHATVITCRGLEPVILEDHSILFDNGVIQRVCATQRYEQSHSDAWADLQGRPLGSVLIGLGSATDAQIEEALAEQKSGPGMIGQLLVQMGHVSESDVDQALAVQSGRFAELADSRPITVIDGRGTIVLPGLINTHHHLFQSLTRCVPGVQNAGLFDWLTGLYPRWQQVTFIDVKLAAMISIAELLRSGCTTTSDHMYLFPPASDVRLEAVLEAAEQLGIRLHACRGSMTLGQSDGGLPPDACVEDPERVLEDSARVIDAYHDADPLAMRKIDLAPCAPFNITPELLDATRDLARSRGVLLHTHIAEVADEDRYCLERYNVRPLEYLHQRDWLGQDVYLAHCVTLNDDEVRLLAETGTGVTHCPCSNMRLGSGIAPVRKMLDAGVKLGLAVDGSSSNDGGHLLAEARQALLLHRVAGGAGILTSHDVFRMATVGGASVLGRRRLGKIEPGCAADFAMFDANAIELAGAVAHDPLAALMMTHAPSPCRVIVAGSTVVDNGTIPGFDWPRIVADFNQLVRDRF